MSCARELLVPATAAAAVAGPGAEERDSTRFLPLFPLQIVAFPGELVLLHIFEPRYIQLISESAARGTGFGIVTVVPGGASSIGTEMRVERILRIYDSGNMDVATRGVRTFELKSFERDVEGKLYSGGRVSFKENDPRTEPEAQGALVRLFNHMQEDIGSPHKLAAPYPENLSFVIGHDVGLSLEQKLQLLTISVERDRQKYLLKLLGGTR